jgi:hypothetical protein
MCEHDVFVKRHGGFTVFSNENGFFWGNGSEVYGYFQSLDEATASVDRYNKSEPPYDTPSLEDRGLFAIPPR